MALEDDGYCFACGRRNESGLGLEFRIEDTRAFTEFVPRKAHQGFRDLVHGGIITAVLDETMMKLVLSLGIKVLTAEIVVRFRTPLLVGDKAFAEAEIIKMGSRLIETAARMKKGDGTVVAEARAKLFRQDL